MKTQNLSKLSFDNNVDWILNSGIQSDEGGFRAWYDLKTKAHSYLYSEITGYGITTLLFLHSILKDAILIKKAKEAADWIIASSMHPCGGVKTRLYQNDDEADKIYCFSEENIFSFDTGMVLYGMINLYEATKEERFLKVSEVLARFLLEKMQNRDGSLSPIYNAKTGKTIEPEDKWSNQSGSFHAKVSMGLVDIFKVTGDERYRNAAVRLCEYAVSAQEDCGRFITDRISGTTHLHPHCYTAEGLFYTGVSLNILRFVTSAKKATKWVFEHISPSGINELYKPSAGRFNESRRSDILAQALRLGLVFSINHKVDELKSVLLKYQYLGEDLNQRGGFLFSKDTGHINSWCSMFAIQALAFEQDRGLISKGTKRMLFI